MDDKLVHKWINKVKDKFTKNKQVSPDISEYAFSTEELESINKQNKQKIQELKQEILPQNKIPKEKTPSVLSIKEIPSKEETEPLKNTKEITANKEPIKEEITNDKATPSFINLNKEQQQLVMDKWNEININKIDKDIIEGKDLLNHNYTITYADEAAKFIHYIRKEYEIVICYLIGFNNEKQGIINKTIFSSKIDDEWKYLNNYIKILEKIRNFKK